MSSKLILVLSGPNLNLLGEREPDVYGKATLDDHVATAREAAAAAGYEVEHLQSNHEGALVDAIHGAGGGRRHRLQSGAFTHYAHALADALAAYDGVVVEVHLSNPTAREACGTLGDRPGRHRHNRRVRRRPATGSPSKPPFPSWRPPHHETSPSCRPRRDWPHRPAPGALPRGRHRRLFVTRLVNIRYPTGSPVRRLLLVGPDEVLFVSDGRYKDQSADQLAAAGVPARIEISGTEQKKIVHDAAAAKGYGGSASRPHASPGRQQAQLRLRMVRSGRSSSHRNPDRGLRRVKRRRRGGPHPRRLLHQADAAFANVAPRCTTVRRSWSSASTWSSRCAVSGRRP